MNDATLTPAKTVAPTPESATSVVAHTAAIKPAVAAKVPSKVQTKAPAKAPSKAPAKAAAPKAAVKAKAVKAPKAVSPKPVAKAAPAAVKPVAPKAPVKAPKVAKASKVAVKAEKVKKPKLVRDSFTIPKNEYELLEALKTRGVSLKQPVKKSELLRAGIKLLVALSDAAFLSALKAVPALKTGRPGKAA